MGKSKKKIIIWKTMKNLWKNYEKLWKNFGKTMKKLWKIYKGTVKNDMQEKKNYFTKYTSSSLALMKSCIVLYLFTQNDAFIEYDMNITTENRTLQCKRANIANIVHVLAQINDYLVWYFFPIAKEHPREHQEMPRILSKHCFQIRAYEYCSRLTCSESVRNHERMQH